MKQILKELGLASPTVTLLAFALLAGCNQSDGKVYVPARGQVLIGDKPAEGAAVTLVPAASGESDELRPSGRVGADGAYTLTTYNPATGKVNDGAPPGEYVVLITMVPQPTEANLDRGVGDRLGDKYRDPSRSKLRAAIKADAPDLAIIRLAATDLKIRK